MDAALGLLHVYYIDSKMFLKNKKDIHFQRIKNTFGTRMRVAYMEEIYTNSFVCCTHIGLLHNVTNQHAVCDVSHLKHTCWLTCFTLDNNIDISSNIFYNKGRNMKKIT